METAIGKAMDKSIYKIRRVSLGLLVIMPLVIQGCTQETAVQQAAQSEPLVTVNGRAITEDDLMVMMDKMLARSRTYTSQSSPYDEQMRKTALESMIKMAVIAQESEALASVSERQQIESKVQLYREELLAELYVRQHTAATEPPSREQIYAYYEANQHLFGQKQVRHFEFMTLSVKPEANVLPQYLATLSGLDANNWREQTAALKQQSQVYQLGVANTQQVGLHQAMTQAVERLEEGDVSKVVMIHSKPYVLRLTQVVEQSAKPIEEVIDPIRTSIIARQVQQAMAAASQQLMDTATVVSTVSTSTSASGG